MFSIIDSSICNIGNISFEVYLKCYKAGVYRHIQ